MNNFERNNMEKKFKPFEKVLVKDHEEVWQPDLYGFWDKCRGRHQTIVNSVNDDDILPYEGNEYLIGTTDEPEEEIRLEEGEIIFCTDMTDEDSIDKNLCLLQLRRYKGIRGNNTFDGEWPHAIRFSDFNPNDVEAIKDKILCVKNGKVVKYKTK